MPAKSIYIFNGQSYSCYNHVHLDVQHKRNASVAANILGKRPKHHDVHLVELRCMEILAIFPMEKVKIFHSHEGNGLHSSLPS